MPTVHLISSPDRVLMRAGVLLFLVGLLTGLAVPLMQIPRMALSSHLEGVMNGVLLMILGLMWPKLSLPAWAGAATFWLALYSTFANWLATLLSAASCCGACAPQHVEAGVRV